MSDFSAASQTENQRLIIQRMINSTNVAKPAKILSFSGEPTPTATVQPLTQLKVTLGKDVEYKDYPVIENVPVVIPYAQTAGLLLTLPLQPGDTGLLIIPDRSLSNFFRSGGNTTPPPINGDPVTSAPRAHALADAIFIPGLCHIQQQITAYNTGNIELRDVERKNYISVGPQGIELSDSQCVVKLSSGQFTVTAPTGITLQTPQQAVINSQNINIEGSSNSIKGSLSSTDGTFVDKDGVSLNSHTHSGVETGGGTTGGPVK